MMVKTTELRVLQALAGASQGGAEMHFARLCVALQRAGVAQRAVIRPNEGRANALAQGGVVFVEAPFGGPFDFRTRRILRREIADFAPHIVLTYMNRATQKMPSGNYVQVARLGGYYNLKYYRGCDHLVGITPDIVRHCRDGGWTPQTSHFIANFVDDLERPVPYDRSRLATPEGAPIIFALGRLHENKAFDILIEAMARNPGAYLWLAGEGPLRSALEAQASDLGIGDRVRFLGWQTDPMPYFAAADVYVVPSRHEPLGSVLLEGWMAGVPMVAAASQGPRFIVDDGENGLLVPVDDEAAMGAAIGRLIADRPFALGLAAKGRADYEKNYTEARAVREYIALFEKVLS